LEFFELELAKEPKTDFAATITDVKNHGFFIELSDSMAYGFISASALQNDFYYLDEADRSLIGRRSGRRFCVGDKIKVNVTRVDRFKRQMDFTIAGSSPRNSSGPNAPKGGASSSKGKRNFKKGPKTPQARSSSSNSESKPSLPRKPKQNRKAIKSAAGSSSGPAKRSAGARGPANKAKAARNSSRRRRK